MRNNKPLFHLEWTSVLVLLSVCLGCQSQAKGTELDKAHSPAPIKKATTAREEAPNVPELPKAAPTDCPTFEKPKAIGTVHEKGLKEISGIVSSEKHEGVLWVHNDSGDGPKIYAVNHSGQLLKTFVLSAKAHDWEDIALLSRPGKRDYLYVADTGDNMERRKKGLSIHRFREPRLSHRAGDGKKDRSSKIKKMDTMHLSYPDSPQDSEALLVDPWTKQLLLITKVKLGWPRVYSVEQFQDEAVLHFEGTITPQSAGTMLHLVTGGDISANGRWIILRTYLGVYLFPRLPKQSVFEALNGPACVLTAPKEAQGEAISFLRGAETGDSLGDKNSAPPFLTISEGSDVEIFFNHPLSP